MIFQERNLGKGRAVRTALEAATGDILDHPGRGPRVRPGGVPDAASPDRGREGGRRLRLAFRRQLRASRPELLAPAGQPAADAHLERRDGPEPLGHGHLLQGVSPPRGAGAGSESPGFGVDAEITAKVARGGFRIFEVPVSYFGRSQAEGKKIRLKDGFSALAALARHSFGARPRRRRGVEDLESRRGGRPRRPGAAARGWRALPRLRPHARGRAVGRRADPHPLGLLRGREADRPSSTSSTRPLMKVLSGLALAALPLAAAARQDPDGEPLPRVRPRLLLSQPRSRRPDPRRRARSVSRGARRRSCCSSSSPAARATGPCPRSSRRRFSPSIPTFWRTRGSSTRTSARRSCSSRRCSPGTRPAGGRPPAASILAAACLGLALDDEVLGGLSRSDPPPADAARRAAGSTAPARWLAAGLGRLFAVGALSLLVVLAVYAPVTPRHGPRRPEDRSSARRSAVVGQAPALAERIAAFADVSRPLAHYVGGLASVVRQNAVGGGITYLNGRRLDRGLPRVLLRGVRREIDARLSRRDAGDPRGRVLRRRPEARSRGGSGASSAFRSLVLFLASIGTTYNIGIRHLLPVYPFLALFGAALFARAWDAARATRRKRPDRRRRRWLLLPLVSAVEVARIHPARALVLQRASPGGPRAAPGS